MGGAGLFPKPSAIMSTGRVKPRRFPLRRVGDVNNWLTSTVFDLSEPRAIEAEEALEEAKELLRPVIETHFGRNSRRG